MPSRLRRYDEPGHVHFVTVSTFRRLQFFRHSGACQAFVEGMKLVRDRHPIRWIGYVVMPEHVHFAVLPQRTPDQTPIPISLVLQELKSLTGRMGKASLREVWHACHSLGTASLDAWATGRIPGASPVRTRDGLRPLWKPRAYDFNVCSERTLLEKVNYMHANPVRRGLIERAEDRPWSSYRFYELHDESLIAMDWDGGFPVV